MVSFPAQGGSESTSFRKRGISQKKRKKDGRWKKTGRLLCPCWLGRERLQHFERVNIR